MVAVTAMVIVMVIIRKQRYIVLHEVERRKCLMIDVAILADKEVEKITKYAQLK